MFLNKVNRVNKNKSNKIKKLVRDISLLDDKSNLTKYIFKKEFDRIMGNKNLIPEYTFTNDKLCLYEDILGMFTELHSKHKEALNQVNELTDIFTDIDAEYKTNMLRIYNETISLKAKCNNFNKSSRLVIDDFSSSSNVSSKNINASKDGIELLSNQAQYGIKAPYVEIMDGSDGFIGNTHVAYIEDSRCVFDGERDLKLDFENIFSKENSFEYEKIIITRDTYSAAGGYGFKYNENIPFVSFDNKKVNLILKITLRNEVMINCISFQDNQGTNKYIIRNVSIYSADMSTSQVIATNVTCNKYNVLNFKKQQVQSVIIKLEQNKTYKCKIGHYYDSSNACNDGYYTSNLKDIRIGSLCNLGIGYSNGKIINPKNYVSKNEITTVDHNVVKNNLFNLPYPIELLDAERASISINNFHIKLNKYEKEGSFTRTYNFDYDIESIALDASEYIPEGLDTNAIDYFISFNNINWLRVVPKYRCKFTDIGVIRINSAEYYNNSNVAFINTLDNPRQFMLKVILKTSNEDYSPIINNIELDVKEVK